MALLNVLVNYLTDMNGDTWLCVLDDSSINCRTEQFPIAARHIDYQLKQV